MVQTYTVHFGKGFDGQFSVEYASFPSDFSSPILQNLAKAKSLISPKLGPDFKPNRWIDLTRDFKPNRWIDLTRDQIDMCQRHRDSRFRGGHTALDRLDTNHPRSYLNYNPRNPDKYDKRARQKDDDLIFCLKKKNSLDLMIEKRLLDHE